MPKPSGATIALAKIKAFLVDNRIESAVLVALFLLAAVLRFYRVAAYMPFGGDEGRDALIVRALLVNHHLPLLGSGTSVGNLYLGPLYYYMMALPMAIWWLNPIGPVVQIGVIGLVAGGILYWLARRWFGVWPALAALSLYSVSYILVQFAHGSINAHPGPLFALLAVLGLDQVKRTGNNLWLILTGLAAGAIIQTHYMALVFLPAIGLIGLYAIATTKHRRNLLPGLLLAVAAFLVVQSPLIVYDLRHHGQNLRAFEAIILGQGAGQAGQGLNLSGLGHHLIVIYRDTLVGAYLGAQQAWLTGLLMVALGLGEVAWAVLVARRRRPAWPFVVVTTWLVVSIIGATVYQQVVYPYYFEFLAPGLFLLAGAIVALPSALKGRLRPAAGAIALLLVAVTVIANLRHSTLLQPPGDSLAGTQAIARYILTQTHGQPYRLVLLANGNYESGYHFFLEKYGQPPAVDPALYPDLQAPPVQPAIKHLVVICELPSCDPFDPTNAVIRSFGSGRIDSVQHFKADKKSSRGGTAVYYLSR